MHKVYIIWYMDARVANKHGTGQFYLVQLSVALDSIHALSERSTLALRSKPFPTQVPFPTQAPFPTQWMSWAGHRLLQGDDEALKSWCSRF